MTKKLANARSYNIEEYWDSMELKTGLLAATITATIPVPANSFIQHCIAKVIKNVNMTSGTALLTVGDADDADGYLKEMSLQEATGTIFGNSDDEVGEYILSQTTYAEDAVVRPDYQFLGNFSSAARTITATLTVSEAVDETEGSVRIWVKIIHLIDD